MSVFQLSMQNGTILFRHVGYKTKKNLSLQHRFLITTYILNAMSKLFIRFTVIFVALYICSTYIASVFFEVDIWSAAYRVLFEIGISMCMTAQGRFHCRYLRWTMYGITAQDALVELDNFFDIFPADVIVIVPSLLIIAGLSTTLVLATIHYLKVRKIKKQWQSQH